MTPADATTLTALTAELRRLLAAATPGEWGAYRGHSVMSDDTAWVATADEDNVAFIAAAYNALPALLDAAERLAAVEARCARLEAVLRDVAENYDCDADGHRYNTGCRACDARAAIKEDTDD